MAFYMGDFVQQNKLTRGLKIPSFKVGQYSINMVVQMASCCGAGADNGEWDRNAGLVLAGPDEGTNTQKRLGIIGTPTDAGVGLHRQAKFDGFAGAADLKPQILGFVFKEGKLTVFKNGVKLGTVPAFGAAVSNFGFLDGFLSEETIPRGQIAELKVYNTAFSDTVMLRLHKLLECKWHVSDGGATCADAEGSDGTYHPPGAGSLRLGMQTGQYMTVQFDGSGGGSGTASQEDSLDGNMYLTSEVTKNEDGVFTTDVTINIARDSHASDCLGPQNKGVAELSMAYSDPNAGFHLEENLSGPDIDLAFIPGYWPNLNRTTIDVMATWTGDPELVGCLRCNQSMDIPLRKIEFTGYFQTADGGRDYVHISAEGNLDLSNNHCTTSLPCAACGDT